MSEDAPRGSRDTDRKLRYFCQRCGFDSPPGGRWNRTASVTATVLYYCPECGHLVYLDPGVETVAGRPREGRDASDGPD